MKAVRVAYHSIKTGRDIHPGVCQQMKQTGYSYSSTSNSNGLASITCVEQSERKVLELQKIFERCLLVI